MKLDAHYSVYSDSSASETPVPASMVDNFQTKVLVTMASHSYRLSDLVQPAHSLFEGTTGKHQVCSRGGALQHIPGISS